MAAVEGVCVPQPFEEAIFSILTSPRPRPGEARPVRDLLVCEREWSAAEAEVTALGWNALETHIYGPRYLWSVANGLDKSNRRGPLRQEEIRRAAWALRLSPAALCTRGPGDMVFESRSRAHWCCATTRRAEARCWTAARGQDATGEAGGGPAMLGVVLSEKHAAGAWRGLRFPCLAGARVREHLHH